jgi:uncharacterized protein YbjT (DUF2867 family)
MRPSKQPRASSIQPNSRLPKRVVVLGASGLIGSAVSARLAAEGVHVTGVSRSPGGGVVHRWIAADIATLDTPERWLPYLKDQDAVVNCAGVLQDSSRDSTAGVHRDGISALFQACEQAGVRKVVHLSAIGVDRETPSAFSETKLSGDRDLQQRDLDWVILRPSVVVGHAAYGGSALFRGLAALPIAFEFPQTAPLQIVQLDDLLETIVFFLRSESPSRMTLEIAGPERLSLSAVVATFRKWLGKDPAPTVRLPSFLARVGYWLGDFAGVLGWRPPIRSTARLEMARGAIGDPTTWQNLTGVAPTSLGEALAKVPASVQEKWFANLYFLKPVVFAVFALFWIATGIISLGPGWDIGMEMLRRGGIPNLAPYAIAAGALADIFIGIGIAYRPTTRIALWAALTISVAYLVIGTVLVPELWRDPLGPMLKIWPIMAFNLVALAILDDR